jgi:hypothetical protein
VGQVRAKSRLATNSSASRTVAAKRSARAAHAASWRSSRPYSFIAAPHPAALTITASTPAASKASMFRRARSRAASASPLWRWSAPQQT